MTDPLPDPAPDAVAARPFGPALALALRGRCPACGEGRLFAHFLKPVPACAQCGQRWDLHQADDFPSYIVILLLGHILVPLMIEVNSAFAIPLGWQAAIWPTLAFLLAVAMIQPVKGGVIAFQWTRRMAGFR
ncbi:DUF983 domain-containing protein [Sphingobium sp. SA2]|jgi:uncharacterized protein (DUF983 family)|uniref:DUF983 domain-containing protein n=1 Tax=unclassified Sphingobium TaxID=2611147 RepID=UPI000501EB00|nr:MULTISPECIES: DUF983 domain-containing protein [unclassified Sphingobium]AOF95852.1 hypothetical protein BSY17_787 [Sphingobium sp. RAC03]MDT7533271.1 DUF983 domain-containing protein [Sphingobium sp. SA2]|tara:strand:- start:3092 stop:3487 length:396 start_codon:yes stop_codon:yes gene_type:complete